MDFLQLSSIVDVLQLKIFHNFLEISTQQWIKVLFIRRWGILDSTFFLLSLISWLLFPDFQPLRSFDSPSGRMTHEISGKNLVFFPFFGIKMKRFSSLQWKWGKYWDNIFVYFKLHGSSLTFLRKKVTILVIKRHQQCWQMFRLSNPISHSAKRDSHSEICLLWFMECLRKRF